MGDPKKLKKKYSTPRHPWKKSSIDAEKKIKEEYGLRIKKELFVAASFLKKYKDIAKKLTATKTTQAEKEKVQVLTKLQQLGLLSVGAGLDQILGLELKDILERRLQSVVFRKGLARSMKQARQFIVHRHIMVGKKEISTPSYLVSLEEESLLGFKAKSTLADEEHPERAITPKVEDQKKEMKEKIVGEVKEKKEEKSEEKEENIEKVEEKPAENKPAEPSPDLPPQGEVVVEEKSEEVEKPEAKE